MVNDMKYSVFKIQHFCTEDGPGIRTTVFFKGCPLKCIWCHNPEGISPKPNLWFMESKCGMCGRCENACQKGVHIFENGHVLEREKCIACGECVKACPVGALELYGTQMSADEIVADVCKDSIFYGDGGGVTLSGGEPFAQGEKLLCLLEKFKEKGISVCIETCGYTDAELLRKAAPLVDIFLYDIKETDDENHKKFTGVGRERIMSNLAMLDSIGAKIILRCPVIPNCNDRTEHFEAIADIALSHKSVIKVELEPYHPLGLGKSLQFGIKPSYTEEKFLSAESLTGARELIRARGITVA